MTRIPFHPLLFALLPVLSSYAATPGTGHPDELLRSVQVVTVVSALLVLVAGAIYRDLRAAALCVSVVVLALVTLGSVYPVIEHVSIAGVQVARRRYVLPLAYAALAAWSIWIYRRRAWVPRLTGLANMVALGAIVPPVVTLGLAGPSERLDPASSREPIIAAGAVASRPDIYYLVFDRYGDDRTTRAYGLDNDLDDYLESKGFYVARESRSNYMKTVLSLGSSLNLDYLDEIARGRENSSSLLPIYDHVAHHRVGAFLRSLGYSYTHLGSWYWPTRENPQATRNVNYYALVPRPVVRLLDSVLFEPVQQTLRHPWIDSRLQIWDNVRRQIDEVLRLAGEPGPKFVLLHVLVPHPPYVFGRDGSYVNQFEEDQRSFHENYRNQVRAANSMIRRLVDGILSASSTPPVIIVQGDEGPYPPGTSAHDYRWRDASLDILRVRSGILNAYHLPGVETRELYPTITPVNSFRLVFNAYFGTNLSLLPDRTFRHAVENRPYAFEDVTNDLRSAGRNARASEADGQ